LSDDEGLPLPGTRNNLASVWVNKPVRVFPWSIPKALLTMRRHSSSYHGDASS
jgi:hypothetical protein